LSPTPARPGWANLAAGAVIALAAVVACRKVWNFDIFWQLKSGQWMLSHHRVLAHDPFTSPDPAVGDDQSSWVNVHWGFQVIVASIHALSGFAGLVVLKMAAFAGTLAVLALWLRRRVGPAWLMLAGWCIVVAAENRVRARPEIFTFLFLALTLVIVESVRRGAPARRLWWLAGLNVVWVNMHGVYVVGIASTWALAIGALIDRRLRRDSAGALHGRRVLGPILAATAACLVSPWPIRAALQPLLLRTRVSGEQAMYSFGVQEFSPTYLANPFTSVPMMVLLAALLAVVAAIGGLVLLEIVKAHPATVPVGHVLWLGMFAALAVTAVRNVMLAAIPIGFLLAIHGGALLRRIAEARPGWARVRLPASIAALVLLVATAAGYTTEWVYRHQGRQANRVGFGQVQGLHAIDMARWLGASELDGDILPLDFGEGGVFIYHSYPRRKVWMDGRLEAHSLKRFERLYEIRTRMLSSAQAADPAVTPLPPSVRFIVVRADDTRHLEALSGCPRFALAYVDRASVCFARRALAGEQVAWAADADTDPPTPNLAAFDKPVGYAPPPAPLLDVETRRRWFRRNPPAAHWRMGAVFYSLGLDRLAIRYLTVADALGLHEPIWRVGLLAQAHQRLGEQEPIEPDVDLPADPNLSRALALYETVDLSDLAGRQTQTFALVRIRALIKGRQIDAAAKAVSDYLDNLPIPKRWRPSAEALAVRDAIKTAHDVARANRARMNFDGFRPIEQALSLVRKNLGLIDAAIDTLAAVRDPARPERRLLGDLYLRKGLTAKARRAYGRPGAGDWALTMRLGLCDWADGRFADARRHLSVALRAAPTRAEPALYLALLAEQLGQYADAANALAARPTAASRPAAGQTGRLTARVIARLRARGFDVKR